MESLVWIHSEGNTRAPTLSGVNAWAAPSAGAMQNNKSSQWKDHVTAGEGGGGGINESVLLVILQNICLVCVYPY